MIVSDLFEASSEIPIASGVVNPATGRVWLPSELRAAQDAEQVKQATLAAQTQAERDQEDTAIPLATSSTAPAPTSVKYSGALAPQQKKAPTDFTKAGFGGYKMSGTPSVPTVPNMTQAPGAPAKPRAPLPGTPPGAAAFRDMSAHLITAPGSPSPAPIPSIAKPTLPTVNTGMQDIINRLTSQIRTIKNKDDLKKIKQNIDREFTRKGVVSESAFVKRDILVKRANAKLARILK